jgi:hypothetical protein
MTEYTVYPDSPSLPEDIFIPEDRVKLPTFIVGVLYCVLWFAFYGLLVLLDRYIENPPRWLGWTVTILVFVVPGILVHLIHERIKDKKRAKLFLAEKTRLVEERAESLFKEAESISTNLNAILASSSELAVKASEYLKNASGWLQTARREYAENAYDPFWTAIENAAVNIDAFRVIFRCCGNSCPMR